VLTEFSGMFADVGRAIRFIGKLIDDPIDDYLGRRELGQLKTYLSRLTGEQWEDLPRVLDVDWYAIRLVECIRYDFMILATAT